MSAVPTNRKPRSPDRGDRIAELIATARDGCEQAFGELLEGCRRYLLKIANESLDSGMRPKGGASDLVQDTFVEAQRGFERFRGTTEDELLAWLREVLQHKIANHYRHYGTQKRSVKREVLVELEVLAHRAVADNSLSDPARVAIAAEEQVRLARALAQLPAHHREIIELRSLQRQSFQEIAEQIGKSADAVRKQWARAVLHLQQHLQ